MYKIVGKKLFIRLILYFILAFLFIFISNSKATYAFSYDINLKQNIIVNKEFNDPRDEFTYVLEALSDNVPLPEGAKGEYKFIMRGSGYKTLSIDTEVSGRYKYKLYQEKNDKVKFCEQDLQVYTLEINVIRTYEGLKIWWYIIKDSNNHKIENIEFTNIYNIPEEAVRGGSNRVIPAGNRFSNIQGPDSTIKENEKGIIESRGSNQAHKYSIKKLLSIPKTGDAANLVLYFILFGNSFVFLLIFWKKKKDYLSS